MSCRTNYRIIMNVLALSTGAANVARQGGQDDDIGRRRFLGNDDVRLAQTMLQLASPYEDDGGDEQHDNDGGHRCHDDENLLVECELEDGRVAPASGAT